jgi:hypothetical protein
MDSQHCGNFAASVAEQVDHTQIVLPAYNSDMDGYLQRSRLLRQWGAARREAVRLAARQAHNEALELGRESTGDARLESAGRFETSCTTTAQQSPSLNHSRSATTQPQSLDLMWSSSCSSQSSGWAWSEEAQAAKTFKQRCASKTTASHESPSAITLQQTWHVRSNPAWQSHDAKRSGSIHTDGSAAMLNYFKASAVQCCAAEAYTPLSQRQQARRWGAQAVVSDATVQEAPGMAPHLPIAMGETMTTGSITAEAQPQLSRAVEVWWQEGSRGLHETASSHELCSTHLPSLSQPDSQAKGRVHQTIMHC